MTSTTSENALRGQQSRIMNAMRAATTNQPGNRFVDMSKGFQDIAQSLMSQTAGGPNYFESMNKLQNQQLQTNIDAETGIYNQMKEQAARGDAEVQAIDSAIGEVTGQDPKLYTTILQDLHADPEPVNANNARGKVMKYAAQRGIVPMSVQAAKSKLSQMQRENSGEDIGATGNIIKKIASERNIPFSQAAYLYQTGFRGDKQYDEQGNIIPLSGAPEARGVIKEGEAAGTARGKGLTEAKIEAQAILPNVVAGADESLQLLDDLVKHPGLNKAVGIRSAFPVIPGTDAADFVTRLEQLQGKQFLEAYSALKGGGAISEVEGKKAESAIARMNRSQSQKAFREAATEFKDIIQKGVDRAKKKAGVENIPVGGNLGTNTNTPKRLKYNPATGDFE